MNKYLLPLILLFISTDTFACYVGGANPDSAYQNISTLTLYASPSSACSSYDWGENYTYSHTYNETATTVSCYAVSNLNPAYGTASHVNIVNADSAYGACTGDPADNTAGVCNNGEVTAYVTDPNCSDGTLFTADGQNIQTTTTVDLSSEVTQTATTDNAGNTTTTDTTTDTTTTTVTDTAGGTTVNQTATDDVVETVVTTVTDDLGNVVSVDTVTNNYSEETPPDRSEERRVGKECRSRWSQDH